MTALGRQRAYLKATTHAQETFVLEKIDGRAMACSGFQLSKCASRPSTFSAEPRPRHKDIEINIEATTRRSSKMPVSSKRSTEQTPQSKTHQTTKRLRLTMSPSRKRALECTQKRAKGTPSVMELLCKPRRPEPSPPENVTQAVATSELVLEPSEYVHQVIDDISANRLD